MNFLGRLEMLMRQKNLNKAQLAAEAGIKATTVYSWWHKGYEGITLPSLKALSKYFGCSMDWLVYGETNEYVLSPDEKTLIDLYRSMNDSGKKLAMETIAAFSVSHQSGDNSIPVLEDQK